MSDKRFNIVAITMTIIMVIVTILFINGEKLGLTLIVDEDKEDYVSNEYFTNNDLKSDLSNISTTDINLNHPVNNSGYYQDDNNIVITTSGYYHITGNLDNGSIIVNSNDNSKVWLILDNVSITNDDDVCIKVENADKVFINVKSDNYLVANISDETYDGAIYSKDDLTINGTGSLNINSNIHGIVSNDSLTIVDTSIDINAKKDGLHVNDSIEISNVYLNIVSDDGMTCDSDDSYIYIESGNIVINCDDDAIKSENEIIIDGGSINISNCYEGIEALNITINDGDILIYANDDGINASGNGMPNVVINGGNISIINTNGIDVDGIDSNGNIIINGGKVFVNINGSQANNAFDYGMENGGSFIINGGYVIGLGSSSMVENVSSDSLQNCIEYYGSNTSDVVNIQLVDGNEVLIDEQTFTGFNYLLISSPELLLNNSYELIIDGNKTTVDINENITVMGNSTNNMFNKGGMNNHFNNDQNMEQFPNRDDNQKGMMKPNMDNMLPDGENQFDRPMMDNKEGMMDRGNRQSIPVVEESVGTTSEPLSTSSILMIISSIVGIIIAIVVVKKYHRYG